MQKDGPTIVSDDPVKHTLLIYHSGIEKVPPIYNMTVVKNTEDNDYVLNQVFKDDKKFDRIIYIGTRYMCDSLERMVRSAKHHDTHVHYIGNFNRLFKL